MFKTVPLGILDDRFCGVGYADSWMDERLESKKSEIGGEGCRDFTKKCQLPLARVVCWLRTKGVRRFLQYRRKSRASLPIGRCPGECLSITRKTPHT